MTYRLLIVLDIFVTLIIHQGIARRTSLHARLIAISSACDRAPSILCLYKEASTAATLQR